MAASSQPNFTDQTAEAVAAQYALASVVTRYTVALILEGAQHIGSGVLVSAGGALFVATARHVARDLPPGDVYCIPKAPGPIRIGPREEVLSRVDRGELQSSERFILHIEERILSTDGSDVALLRIRDRPPELHDMEFYPLNNARSDSLPHPRVIIHGYAAELTIVHAPSGRAAAMPRVIAGTLGAVSDSEYEPARDLIITYVDPRPIAAAGMSGGGVWLWPEREEGPWNPQAMLLVGIQVRQFPDSRAAGRPLCATRIERLQALLKL